MGIRIAFLVVQAPPGPVLAFLSERYGPLPPASRTLDAAAAMDVGIDDGVLLVASDSKLSVVMDPGFVLPSDPDLAVEVARRLRCPAAALITESTTETHQLVVAGTNGLKRAYYYSGESGVGPLLLGSPLPSETSTPLNDSTGGEDLLALLADEGFDVHSLLESGSWEVLEPPARWTGKPSRPGPITAEMKSALDRWYAQTARPITGATPTSRAVIAKKSADGWLKRLFGG